MTEKQEATNEPEPKPEATEEAAKEEKRAEEHKRKPSHRLLPPPEEPKRETVVLRHVTPKVPAHEEEERPATGSLASSGKRSSLIEERMKVFEPEGTPVRLPESLRNSLRISRSKKTAHHQP